MTTMTALKLELGESYIRRDGEVTGKLAKGIGKQPFKDPRSKTLYYPDGLVTLAGLSTGANESDIIAENKPGPDVEGHAKDAFEIHHHTVDTLTGKPQWTIPDWWTQGLRSKSKTIEEWGEAGADGAMWDLPPVEVQQAAARILLQVQAHGVMSSLSNFDEAEEDDKVIAQFLRNTIDQTQPEREDHD